jgi:hypothetical protein
MVIDTNNYNKYANIVLNQRVNNWHCQNNYVKQLTPVALQLKKLLTMHSFHHHTQQAVCNAQQQQDPKEAIFFAFGMTCHIKLVCHNHSHQ